MDSGDHEGHLQRPVCLELTLPAVYGTAGDKVHKPRIPWVKAKFPDYPAFFSGLMNDSRS